jgi:hypothetical protein
VRLRIVLAMLALLVVGLLATPFVLAQEGPLAEKLRTGNVVTVAAGETVAHDLYAFGGTVTIAGNVTGDVVASGGQVTVSGSVTGDVVAAGGTVAISGKVDGDVRAAGGTVTIGGAVGEDALVAGGQVSIGQGSTVGGDVIVGAGRFVLDGAVTGSVVGEAGSYTRSGTIGGTEDVRIQQPPAQAQPTATARLLDAIRYVIAVVAFGILAWWLAPRLVLAAVAAVVGRPLPSLGWGIAALVGFVGLVIVLIILGALVGAILAVLGFGGLVALDVFALLTALSGLFIGFAVVVGFLVDALVGFALARYVSGRRGVVGAATPDPGMTRVSQDLPTLVVGAAVIAILSSLPLVGGLVKLVVALVGLGALVLAYQERRRSRVATGP